MSFHATEPRICIICAAEFLPKSPRQKCCSPACSRELHKRTNRENYLRYGSRVRADQADRRKRKHQNICQTRSAPQGKRARLKSAPVECKCPMCKGLHQVLLAYKPAIRPWIYCYGCRPVVESRSHEVEALAPYSVGYR